MPAGTRLILPPDAGVPATVDGWIPFGWDLAAGNRGTYYLRTVARLRPGTGFAAANQLPLDDMANWSTGYRFHGAPEDAAFEADARVVSPGYFRAVGVRLAAGRCFAKATARTAARW